MVKSDIGELSSIPIYFPSIVDEFGETGDLGELSKLLEVELEVMEKESVVGCKPHLGKLILVFCEGHALCAGAFAPLWCTLKLKEACVGLLVPGIHWFSLDGLNYVVDSHVLEGLVVAHGFD